MKQSGNDGQMRWYHVVIVILYAALLVAMLLIFSPQFASAATGPEVHCQAVADDSGMVQLDCYGPVMREVYERYVPAWRVYEALGPIAQEWSFDLTWQEV